MLQVSITLMYEICSNPLLKPPITATELYLTGENQQMDKCHILCYIIFTPCD